MTQQNDSPLASEYNEKESVVFPELSCVVINNGLLPERTGYLIAESYPRFNHQ
jgi:hypothetical protein